MNDDLLASDCYYCRGNPDSVTILLSIAEYSGCWDLRFLSFYAICHSKVVSLSFDYGYSFNASRRQGRSFTLCYRGKYLSFEEDGGGLMARAIASFSARYY